MSIPYKVQQYFLLLLKDREEAERLESHVFQDEQQAPYLVAEVLFQHNFTVKDSILAIVGQLENYETKSHSDEVENAAKTLKEAFEHYREEVLNHNVEYFKREETKASGFIVSFFNKISLENCFEIPSFKQRIQQPKDHYYILLGKIQQELNKLSASNPITRNRKRKRHEQVVKNIEICNTGWTNSSPKAKQIEAIFNVVLKLMQQNDTLQSRIKQNQTQVQSIQEGEFSQWNKLVQRIESFIEQMKNRPHFEFPWDHVQSMKQRYITFLIHLPTVGIASDFSDFISYLQSEAKLQQQHLDSQADLLIEKQEHWSTAYSNFLTIQTLKSTQDTTQSFATDQLLLLQGLHPHEQTGLQLYDSIKNTATTQNQFIQSKKDPNLDSKYAASFSDLYRARDDCLTKAGDYDFALYKKRIVTLVESEMMNNRTNWRYAIANYLQKEIDQMKTMEPSDIVTNSLVTTFKRCVDSVQAQHDKFNAVYLEYANGGLKVPIENRTKIREVLRNLKVVIERLTPSSNEYTIKDMKELQNEFPMVANAMFPVYWAQQLSEILELGTDECHDELTRKGKKNKTILPSAYFDRAYSFYELIWGYVESKKSQETMTFALILEFIQRYHVILLSK